MQMGWAHLPACRRVSLALTVCWSRRGTAAWLQGQGHRGARASSVGASAANDTLSELGARAALATRVLCTFVLVFKAP